MIILSPHSQIQQRQPQTLIPLPSPKKKNLPPVLAPHFLIFLLFVITMGILGALDLPSQASPSPSTPGSDPLSPEKIPEVQSSASSLSSPQTDPPPTQLVLHDCMMEHSTPEHFIRLKIFQRDSGGTGGHNLEITETVISGVHRDAWTRLDYLYAIPLVTGSSLLPQPLGEAVRAIYSGELFTVRITQTEPEDQDQGQGKDKQEPPSQWKALVLDKTRPLPDGSPSVTSYSCTPVSLRSPALQIPLHPDPLYRDDGLGSEGMEPESPSP